MDESYVIKMLSALAGKPSNDPFINVMKPIIGDMLAPPCSAAEFQKMVYNMIQSPRVHSPRVTKTKNNLPDDLFEI